MNTRFRDENGEKIVNKFGYLKNSILNNIARIKNNELLWDDELGWFKDIEDKIEINFFKYLSYGVPFYIQKCYNCM